MRLVPYILTLISLISFSSVCNEGNAARAYNVSFGVKIGILPTGGITQFALIHYRNGQLTNIQAISDVQLMKIGTGLWPVPGTNIRYNYFKENNFSHIQTPEGEFFERENFQAAFDSLWKIRFDYHPFDPKKGKGWSNGKFKPSLEQQAYIYNTYGVRGYDQDYFSDTSFFKLLRDVLDEAWIENYKSLR
jgi:hypothetical protein